MPAPTLRVIGQRHVIGEVLAEHRVRDDGLPLGVGGGVFGPVELEGGHAAETIPYRRGSTVVP